MSRVPATDEVKKTAGLVGLQQLSVRDVVLYLEREGGGGRRERERERGGGGGG